MDDIIKIINHVQSYNNEFNDEPLSLPEIVVIGSQSTGKSSVLERIIGHEILPKSTQMATRCPINLLFFHDENVNVLSSIFQKNAERIDGVDSIRKKLQSLTDEIEKQKKGVDSKPIIIQLRGKTFPTLTLTDLPGIIKNSGDLPNDSPDKIMEIAINYAKSPNTIILAVSAANFDLANSDSICLANKYDPQGKRTIHVITKVDLMVNEDIEKILQDKCLENSIATVCLANKKDLFKCMEDYENDFLKKALGINAKKHGIQALIKLLVQILITEIKRKLPHLKEHVKKRITSLQKGLSDHEENKQANNLNTIILHFCDLYKNLIDGNEELEQDSLQGGAKISFILYKEYRKNMNEIKVDEMTKEMILFEIRNSAGRREVSYSIEKPFRKLLQKQIVKFFDPSIQVLDKVSLLLKDFLDDVLKRVDIDQYPNLKDHLIMEMMHLIDKIYESTKTIIKNLIKCEKNDVFCERPNSQFYESKKSKDKGGTNCKDFFGKILIRAVKTVIPPVVKTGLSLMDELGLFENSKETISWDADSFSQNIGAGVLNLFKHKGFNENSVLDFFKENPDSLDKISKLFKGDGNLSLPPEVEFSVALMNKYHLFDKLKEIKNWDDLNLTNIIGDGLLAQLKEKNLKEDTVHDYLKQNPETISKIVDYMQIDDQECKDIYIKDIITIEELVQSNFDIIRKNLIYNVPKNIQLFLITNLISSMFKCLSSLQQFQDDLLEDSTGKAKIEQMESELKKLEDLLQDLKKIK